MPSRHVYHEYVILTFSFDRDWLQDTQGATPYLRKWSYKCIKISNIWKQQSITRNFEADEIFKIKYLQKREREVVILSIRTK